MSDPSFKIALSSSSEAPLRSNWAVPCVLSLSPSDLSAMLQPHVFCELESFLQLDVMVIYNSYFRSAATGDDLLKIIEIEQKMPVDTVDDLMIATKES